MTIKELEKDIKNLTKQNEKLEKQVAGLISDNNLLQTDLERTRQESRAKDGIRTFIKLLIHWDSDLTLGQRFWSAMKKLAVVLSLIVALLTIYYHLSGKFYFTNFFTMANDVLNQTWGNIAVIDPSTELAIYKHELARAKLELANMYKSGDIDVTKEKHLEAAIRILTNDIAQINDKIAENLANLNKVKK
jgi:hypothetical protein